MKDPVHHKAARRASKKRVVDRLYRACERAVNAAIDFDDPGINELVRPETEAAGLDDNATRRLINAIARKLVYEELHVDDIFKTARERLPADATGETVKIAAETVVREAIERKLKSEAFIREVSIMTHDAIRGGPWYASPSAKLPSTP
jgi:hypothetical protein